MTYSLPRSANDDTREQARHRRSPRQGGNGPHRRPGRLGIRPSKVSGSLHGYGGGDTRRQGDLPTL